MIKINGVNHVAIRCANFEKSRDFYEGVFGLKSIPRPEVNVRGGWYTMGNTQFHMFETSNAIPMGNGIDPGKGHMAIEVEDFEATKAELERLGIPFLDGTRMMTEMSEKSRRLVGRAVFIQDPDGNVIELRKGV